MDAKEIFSAAIRVIGLLAIGRGLYDLLYVALFSAGGADYTVTAKYPGFDLIVGIFYMVLGLYLLRGAKFVVDYAFPEEIYDPVGTNEMAAVEDADQTEPEP